ncbi:MAG: hypothetical protein LBT74_00475 [Acidobacteriota bacterium]|jgi:hypothetical protein|nr:hypothetical protein [Acidobacteriota bacterium]
MEVLAGEGLTLREGTRRLEKTKASLRAKVRHQPACCKQVVCRAPKGDVCL